MKKIIISICTMVALTSCDSVTQGLAIKHNDAIVNECNKVIQAFSNVNTSIATYNPDSITMALADYQAQIDYSLQGINKAIALKDSSFKLASIDMLKVFAEVGKNEFSKIRDIYTIPDSLYTKEDEEQVTALATSIDTKIEAAQTLQQNAQIAFSKKYNFPLLSGKDTIK